MIFRFYGKGQILRKSYRENERVDSRDNGSIGARKESEHERMSGSEEKK